MDQWVEELAGATEEKQDTRAPGKCPTCGHVEDEPTDYDLAGNDVFQCGSCGQRWSYPDGESNAPLVIDNGGF